MHVGAVSHVQNSANFSKAMNRWSSAKYQHFMVHKSIPTDKVDRSSDSQTGW